MITINSIKSRILIFAILATLIPSAGLGLLSFWQNETMLADNVTHQLRMLAGDTTRELEFWLKERVDSLRALASSDAVINGISHQSTASPDAAEKSRKMLPHYLRLVQEKLDPLLELSALDANGQVVASSTDAPTTVSLPKPWPKNAAMEGIIVDPPHWNETRASATFALAVPVLSLDDQILGSLVAIVDLGSIQPRLDFASKPSPGNILLLDLAGRPLLTTHSSITGLAPLDDQVLQRLRARGGETMAYDDPQRHKVLGLAQIPRTLPLIVVAERNHKEIYRAWALFRNLFLASLAGLTLLVALVGWRMGRSIVTPLVRLTRAADRIAGGDLAVQLPVVKHDEIGHLTQVFNQMTDKLRHSREEIEAASLVLQQQNQRLETLSITDNLTGLYNRNKLNAILADQLARYRRHQHPFTVLMLDIDHFKVLNDTHGHLAGDEVLKSAARTISHAIRSVDYVARYGGEEFVVVLPETTTTTAHELAERIRSQVQGSRCQFDDQSLMVTMSIGVAGVRDNDETADEVIARADHALYEAKRAGRNQVHCAL